jgi:hypothetical protein
MLLKIFYHFISFIFLEFLLLFAPLSFVREEGMDTRNNWMVGNWNFFFWETP